jgi:ATP citrate (pro-S)-lyase
MFATDIQFGHAGASVNAESETAVAKNKSLAASGAIVPPSFDELGEKIAEVYQRLVVSGVIGPMMEEAPPTVPMDYTWARVGFRACGIGGSCEFGQGRFPIEGWAF